jgi:hypothetical protein
MTPNEELERAVERVRHRVDLESDNPYVVSAWSADDVLTRIVPHDDLVEMADAFRALLSERAELLATVERMRGALETKLLEAKINCNGSKVSVAYADGVIDTYNAARAAFTTTTEQGERG